MFNKDETIVPFESISDQIVKSFSISKLFLLICFFFLALFVFNTYHYYFGTNTNNPAELSAVIKPLVWFALATTGTWMRSVKYIGITCAGTDLFFMDIKGKQNPQTFIDEIIKAKYKYFKDLDKEFNLKNDNDDNFLESNVTIH